MFDQLHLLWVPEHMHFPQYYTIEKSLNIFFSWHVFLQYLEITEGNN